jgi:two-component system, OmpR family, phosphate regulon response regulator PhoB
MAMKNTQILVIEDEQDIRDLISFQLKSAGHQVLAVESVERAIGLMERGEKVDLFIVDWMLPGSMNGLDFIKRLKTHKNYQHLPVIMLTALTTPENIVAGLDAGADDYMTKPFDLNVLEARVRVQLRHLMALQEGKHEEHLHYGDLKIEISKCRVWINEEEISLTSTEFKILLLLAQRPGHVYTRDQFINNIQGEHIYVTGRTIDTHIAGLRKKMGDLSNMIETIRGIGYRFKDVI